METMPANVEITNPTDRAAHFLLHHRLSTIEAQLTCQKKLLMALLAEKAGSRQWMDDSEKALMQQTEDFQELARLGQRFFTDEILKNGEQPRWTGNPPRSPLLAQSY